MVDVPWTGLLIYATMTGAWWLFVLALAIAVVLVPLLVNSFW